MIRKRQIRLWDQIFKPATNRSKGLNSKLHCKKWDRISYIVGIGRNRSYHVKLSRGSVYWPNRRYLRPVAPLEVTPESPKRGFIAKCNGQVVSTFDARSKKD